MQLSKVGLSNKDIWEEKNFILPNFDLDEIKNKTKENPIWIHFGAGNIFRAFHGNLFQKLLDKNKKLLIIDGSLGMSPDYIEELWLNPSNLLMVAQNIKNGLIEYVDNTYLIKEIEDKYEELKLKLSELDAEIKLTAENATSNTIVVANKSLNYLKKYGFKVISLDDDNTALDKTVIEVTDMINSNSIKYIYSLENTEDNETVKLLLENNSSLTEIKLKKLDNITSDERNNNDDYFKLMQYNLEQIKKETYK